MKFRLPVMHMNISTDCATSSTDLGSMQLNIYNAHFISKRKVRTVGLV